MLLKLGILQHLKTLTSHHHSKFFSSPLKFHFLLFLYVHHTKTSLCGTSSKNFVLKCILSHKLG